MLNTRATILQIRNFAINSLIASFLVFVTCSQAYYPTFLIWDNPPLERLEAEKNLKEKALEFANVNISRQDGSAKSHRLAPLITRRHSSLPSLCPHRRPPRQCTSPAHTPIAHSSGTQTPARTPQSGIVVTSYRSLRICPLLPCMGNVKLRGSGDGEGVGRHSCNSGANAGVAMESRMRFIYERKVHSLRASAAGNCLTTIIHLWVFLFLFLFGQIFESWESLLLLIFSDQNISAPSKKTFLTHILRNTQLREDTVLRKKLDYWKRKIATGNQVWWSKGCYWRVDCCTWALWWSSKEDWKSCRKKGVELGWTFCFK